MALATDLTTAIAAIDAANIDRSAPGAVASSGALYSRLQLVNQDHAFAIRAAFLELRNALVQAQATANTVGY